MNSRRKGKAGELEAVHALRTAGFTGAMRGQQRSGLEQADVVDAIDGCHIEVKRRARIAALDYLRQAERDCREGTTPVVLMRENNDTGWVVLLRLTDLHDLAESVNGAT